MHIGYIYIENSIKSRFKICVYAVDNCRRHRDAREHRKRRHHEHDSEIGKTHRRRSGIGSWSPRVSVSQKLAMIYK